MQDLEEQEYYKNFANNILKEKKKKLTSQDESKILYFCLAGSHSFNLNVETSDKDYFGLYATDIDDVLVGDIKQPIIDSHEPDDYVLFEVDRFCELLFKGNPKLIEPIFTTRFCYKSPIWEQLWNNRKQLISQSVIYHYISYSKSQMGDASKIIFNNSNNSNPDDDQVDQKQLLLNMINSNHSYHKKLYHTYRLLLDIKRMLNLQEPIVYLEGEERAKIMSIRMGTQDLSQTLQEIQQLFKECQTRFEVVKQENLIPENLNISMLNEWLIQVRKQTYLQKEAAAATPSIKYTESDFEIDDIKSYNLLKVYNHFQSLLDKHKLVGAKILMIKRSGSSSHNLLDDNEIDNSTSTKEDWIGVYVAPTESVFSLYPAPNRIDSSTLVNNVSRIEEPLDNSTNQRDTYLAGIQLFELGYFINLLSAGNHRAVECFYDRNNASDKVESKIWKDIKSLGVTGYLSVNLIHHCWGISKGLIEKVQKSLNNTSFTLSATEKRKSLYHAQRLINRANEILDKSNYSVYLDQDDDQVERDLLLKIKNSQNLSDDQLLAMINDCSNQIKVVNEKIQKLSNITSKDKKLKELEIKDSLKTVVIKIRKSMIKIVI